LENAVFLAVLFAAVCHAGWNALIKVGLDPLSTTTLIALGSAVVALVALPFAGMPAVAAWPWVVASTVIHLFYLPRWSKPTASAISATSIRSRAARRR
jgi:hypothetical protein